MTDRIYLLCFLSFSVSRQLHRGLFEHKQAKPLFNSLIFPQRNDVINFFYIKYQIQLIKLIGRVFQEYQNMDVRNKKDKKKDKQQQKQFYAMKPIHKMHFQEYQIPPYSQQHLRALFLEYMSFQQFDYPIHHIDILNRIKMFYRNVQNHDIYMKQLDLPLVIRQLHERDVLQMSQRALGTKIVLIVQKVRIKSVRQLAYFYINERPTVQPPDPISFQQQRKQLSTKQKQEKQKIDFILNAPSLLQQNTSILQTLNQVTTLSETQALDQFKKRKNIEYCDHCTRDKCLKARGPGCTKRHFRAIINQNTDQSFGNCPHLNACHNPDCKLIHYVQQQQQGASLEQINKKKNVSDAEWINCDLRFFDFKILGKFNVVMADPPWDIHMSLPYGTLKDKEMLNLRVDLLQDNGIIFLWVTGRAMELGRQCLSRWGYKRVDEIVWVKTNQLHRLIITGKTGHWLNHTKQHCLVGIKGQPKINAKIDCDVIVSTVRETSRKPDQIYSIIERMNPGGKKIELFGRPHNCMPGWLTLGNQLPGVYLRDKQILARYQQAYPQQKIDHEKMQGNMREMSNAEHLNKIYNNHIQRNSSLS